LYFFKPSKTQQMTTVRKRFNLRITEPSKVYNGSFELDKTAKFINGIVMTSDREDILFYRGSQKLTINGQEHFPEDYESKLLMTSLNITANQRYFDLKNLPSGSGIIKIEYKDENHASVPFTPYRVSLYVEFSY
jgi:hypothetical protein